MMVPVKCQFNVAALCDRSIRQSDLGRVPAESPAQSKKQIVRRSSPPWRGGKAILSGIRPQLRTQPSVMRNSLLNTLFGATLRPSQVTSHSGAR